MRQSWPGGSGKCSYAVLMTILLTIIGLGGFFASAAISAYKWNDGYVFRIIPQIFAILFGIILSFFWRMNDFGNHSIIEVVGSTFAISFGFSFCAWMAILEKGRKND